LLPLLLYTADGKIVVVDVNNNNNNNSSNINNSNNNSNDNNCRVLFLLVSSLGQCCFLRLPLIVVL